MLLLVAFMLQEKEEVKASQFFRITERRDDLESDVRDLYKEPRLKIKTKVEAVLEF